MLQNLVEKNWYVYVLSIVAKCIITCIYPCCKFCRFWLVTKTWYNFGLFEVIETSRGLLMIGMPLLEQKGHKNYFSLYTIFFNVEQI
jgi:hypothetical protein